MNTSKNSKSSMGRSSAAKSAGRAKAGSFSAKPASRAKASSVRVSRAGSSSSAKAGSRQAQSSSKTTSSAKNAQAGRLGRSYRPNSNNYTVGRRNTSLVWRFILLLVIALFCLWVYSRCSVAEGVAAFSLQSYLNAGESSEAPIDPLALSEMSDDFKLLSVGADGKVIGYTSELNSGRAAVSLVSALSLTGWQQSGSSPYGSAMADSSLAVGGALSDSLPRGPVVDEPHSIDQQIASAEAMSGPIAFVLEKQAADGTVYRQLLVQIFPVADGSSIVVSVL